MSFGSKIANAGSTMTMTISILLIVGLFIVRLVSSDQFNIELPNRLQDLLTLSLSVIIESLPFVILGITLSILVRVWLPDQFIVNHLPKWGPLRRACISFMGVLLPVCECGNVPLARGLIIQGFTVSESLTFLIAAPILNPVTIITTQQAFGNDSTVLIARIVGGFLIANIIGWLYSKHKNENSLLTDKFVALCNTPEGHLHTSKIDESLEIFKREANIMLPALFIGAVLAASIQVGVPREILTSLGSDPVMSIAAMMVLAFIVSICSNVDAFFALAFTGTFSVGSIVSFLVFGPIIDIKMLALMRTTYKLKVLLQITVIVALISAAIGLAVNYAF